jgi:hypothetical protein
MTSTYWWQNTMLVQYRHTLAYAIVKKLKKWNACQIVSLWEWMYCIVLCNETKGSKNTARRQHRRWCGHAASYQVHVLEPGFQLDCLVQTQARIVKLVEQLTTDWTVWRFKPGGGEIFCTCPYWPWGPPNLLYNRPQVTIPGVKQLQRAVNHPSHLELS